jgi:hypothetical protein
MSSIAPQLARFDMAMLTLLSNEDTRAIESVKILTMIIENIQNNPLEGVIVTCPQMARLTTKFIFCREIPLNTEGTKHG